MPTSSGRISLKCRRQLLRRHEEPLVDLASVISGVGVLCIMVVGTTSASLQTGKSIPHETKKEYVRDSRHVLRPLRHWYFDNSVNWSVDLANPGRIKLQLLNFDLLTVVKGRLACVHGRTGQVIYNFIRHRKNKQYEEIINMSSWEKRKGKGRRKWKKERRRRRKISGGKNQH